MRSGTPSQRRPAAAWRFCREGDFWTIAYEGRVVRLKDTKGMHYLAQLPCHPGRQFHVCELAAAIGWRCAARGRDGRCERARKAVTNRIRQSVARIAASHPAAGLHLRNAIHTGTVCSYTPDRPVPWCFEPAL